MTTLLLTHPACLNHDVPLGHPESPDRLRAVLRALEDEEFHYLVREEAPAATLEQLSRVHPAYFVEALLTKVPRDGLHRLDADTCMSPGSGDAALRAAGALVRAVDEVMEGRVLNAFCAVRPPGHHAEPTRAMGFCLFNNVAVGALHARAAHGLKRIAVVDFDVHHGNGTQEMFATDPDLFYASSHQAPLYPGTGKASERGIDGNILNVIMEPGTGSEAFRQGMEEKILPALERFGPEFLFISAGFDAHDGDPLANLRLQTEDYAWATERLIEFARGSCSGRVVSTLEGGYDLASLAASAKAHVRSLMAA